MAWAIVLGDCMPEPDSGIQNTAGKPFGYPASARSFLVRAGSYGYFVTWSVNAQAIDGGTGPMAAVAGFFRRSPAVPSRVTAELTAPRPPTSLERFFSGVQGTPQMCRPGLP